MQWPLSIAVVALQALPLLASQGVKQVAGMPVPLFHTPLDLQSIASRIGCGLRSELVAQGVAVVAGGDHVAAMVTSVLLGQKMLARGLQPRGLAQGEPMRGGEAGAVGEPHGEFAVVAEATLRMEGSITGFAVGLWHKDPVAGAMGCPGIWIQNARAPGANWLCRQNTGGIPTSNAFIALLPTPCQGQGFTAPSNIHFCVYRAEQFPCGFFASVLPNTCDLRLLSR